MQKILTMILLCVFLTGTVAFAQSNSFNALIERFQGDDDVNAFELSGLFCRAAFAIFSDSDLGAAVHHVSSVRLIHIPNARLQEQNLTVRGFRNLLNEDHFEMLIQTMDNGNAVEIYIQESGNRKNRYFVLVLEEDALTAIEMKGQIDLTKLKQKSDRQTASR